VLAAILAFAGSCVTNVNEGNPVASDGEHLVTLSFTVPGAPTRAMDEEAVETIDVRLFDPSTDNIVYRALGTKPSAGQFTVKLPSNTYNIVVLANARAMIPAAYPPATTGASFTNDTRDVVLAAITKSIAPVSAHQWPATFDRIPMWGYSDGFVVGASSPTISLTRMIAKVDITVGGAVVDFWLANVRLYNYSTAGNIAPAALPPTAPAGNRYDGYDITQWNSIPAGIKAYAPHLPTGVKATDDYIAYNADPSKTKDIVEYKNSIYAFEAATGLVYPVAGWKQNTCLVIGGYYQSTAFPTYYRVEFANTTNGQLPLLRNHKYNVTITGVSAHGYPTPEDAYNNPPSNITVQITAWNDGGLDDITFDPQNYLAVDKSELTFYAAGGSKSMAAITDFPSGWTVDANDLPTWLTITTPVLDGSDIAHGLQDVKTTLTLAASSTSAARATEFYIVAGNLRKKIIVTQSAEEEFSIFITDPVTGKPLDELTFGAGNATYGSLPAAQTFRVTWFPASANCDVTLTPVAGMTPITFNTTGSGVNPVTISPLTGGSVDIIIQPDALFPSDLNPVSRLDFTVTRGGQQRMAVLYLRQVNNYVIVESVASGYDADGATTHSFTVKSNCSWLSYLDGGGSDLDDLINWKTSGGGPNPAGETFKFILNSRTDPEPATISFTNSDHSLTYATAVIHGVTPPPPYLSLSQTTYKTNTSGVYSREIAMTTNIPASRLGATVTGAGGQVTGATIVADPTLKVDFNNTLLGSSLQTYTVDVTYDAHVMATLTVRVSGSSWNMTDDKLVGPINLDITATTILNNATFCPTGSSQPRSPEEAMWYEANVGNMNSPRGVLVSDFPMVQEGAYGVLWLGAPTKIGQNKTTGEKGVFIMASCIYNQQLYSVENTNNNATYQSTKYIVPHGQAIRYPPSINDIVDLDFRCVVWD
jgi:hypothetical protein